MHAAHTCCTCTTGNPDKTGSSCSCHASCSKECPSTNTCDIPCHTYAAMKIWPCPYGTKMPDPGGLGTVDLDCPQTLFCNAPPHTSPINCHSKSLCNIFSERGMSYDQFRFKNCSHCSRPVDKSSFFMVHIYWFPHHISTCHLGTKEQTLCRYVQCLSIYNK